MSQIIRQFFLPSLTPKFLIRVAGVSLLALLFFSYLCIPIWIQGGSMKPTYHNGEFNFCWRLRYLFSKPNRYDIVTIRLAGQKVMLLKRVVALEGEEVAFRQGKLLVNGKELEEPYLRYPCNWNLPARKVEKDSVYVVGDNRDMPMESHYFGQISIHRIIGGPLW